VPEYYRGSSTAVGGAMAMRWNRPGEVEYSGVAVAGAGDAAMDGVAASLINDMWGRLEDGSCGQ
jgi:hypothetical protein